MENHWPWGLASRGQGHSLYPNLLPQLSGNHGNHLSMHNMATSVSSVVALPGVSAVRAPSSGHVTHQTVTMGTQSPQHGLRTETVTDPLYHTLGGSESKRHITATEDEVQVMNQLSTLYNINLNHFQQWCNQAKGVGVHLPGRRAPERVTADTVTSGTHATKSGTQPDTTGGTTRTGNPTTQCDQHKPVGQATSLQSPKHQAQRPAGNIQSSIPTSGIISQDHVIQTENNVQASWTAVRPTHNTTAVTVASELSDLLQAPASAPSHTPVTAVSLSSVSPTARTTTRSVTTQVQASHTITPQGQTSKSSITTQARAATPSDDEGASDLEMTDEDLPTDACRAEDLVRSNNQRQSYSVVFKLQVAGFYELVKNQRLTARVFGLPRDCVRRWSRAKHNLVKMFLAGDSKSYKTRKRFRQGFKDTTRSGQNGEVVAGDGQSGEVLAEQGQTGEVTADTVDGVDMMDMTDQDEAEDDDMNQSTVKPEPYFDLNNVNSGDETEENMTLSCTNEDYDMNSVGCEQWVDNKPMVNDSKCPIYHIIKGEHFHDAGGSQYTSAHPDEGHLADSQDNSHSCGKLTKETQNSEIVPLELKLKAISHAEQHGLDSAVEAYNISTGTIFNWTKCKPELLQRQRAWEEWKSSLSEECRHSATLETLLLDWFRTSLVLISWDMLQWKAELLASTEESVREELDGEEYSFDHEYMERFLHKHNIMLCEADLAGTMVPSGEDIKALTDAQKADSNLSPITWKNNSDAARQKKCYPLHFKLQVVAHFEKSRNKAATARKYDIDRKQVQSWVQNRDHLFKHIHLGNCARLPGSGRKYMSKTLEDQLLVWMKETEAGGKHVSHSMLKNQARLYYRSDPAVRQECLDKGFENFCASEGWVRSFLRRNGVHSDVPQRNAEMKQS